MPQVSLGQESAFKRDFAPATPFVKAIDGFIALKIGRCREVRGRYSLLVQWRTPPSHPINFRTSANDARGRKLRPPDYDPFPTAAHFEPLAVQ